MPQKITPEQYRQSRANGWTDEDLAGMGYELPQNPARQALPASAPRDAVARASDPNANGGGLKPVLGMARTAAQNAPLVGPWADEAEGAVRGALKTAVSGGGLRENIGREQASARESVDTFRKRMGGVGAVGELATGLVTGNAALKGAGAVTKVALGGDVITPAAGWANFAMRNGARVASGAASGAIMGAGAARPGDRAGGALMGGAVGGLLSTVPAVVEGVQAGKRWADRLALHKGPVNRAHSELLNTMEPDELLNRVAGKPQFPGETVADVAATAPSNYTDQLLRQSVSVPSSRGGQIKREMVERGAGRGARVEESLTKNSGLMAERPDVTVGMIDEVTKPNVRSSYKAALKPKKALDSDELRAILDADDPAIAKAKSFASNKMREFRVPNAKKPFLTDGKDVAMWQTADYNAPFVDYTKRGLDSQIRAAIRTDRLDDAAAIITTRNRLVREADKLIPGYAEARAVDEGRRALVNAMELGRRLGKGTVDVRGAEGMLQKIIPESQDFADEPMVRQMFQRGVADGMRRRMGRASDGVKAINAIVGNPNAKEVARLAFPDEAAFQAFEKQLMDEMRQIPGEALTRGARVDPQFLSTDALGSASPWAVKQALTGEPMLLAAQTAGTLSGQAKKKAGQETAAALTDMARAPVGSKAAQDVARGVRRQRAVPTYQAMQAARQRRKAGEINPMLQRLFQTFVMGAQDR